MGGVLQSTISRRKPVALSESASHTTARSPQVRVDQALERLDLITQQLDIAPTKVFSTGLVEETFFVSSPDGRRTYAASESSSTLVGYYTAPNSGSREEFCRVRLGLQTGGISSVAVGGTWVFAACSSANRVVVLRLCHDYYQNRTRLLVMRVIDGGVAPSRIVTTKQGSLVAVFYAGETLVRIYQCLPNGQLDFRQAVAVTLDTNAGGPVELNLDQPAGKMVIVNGSGTQVVRLESIFKENQDFDTVPR